MSAPTASLARTPLHDRHVGLGAKMVDFGGWHMPVNYPAGILEEHRRVRFTCGLFDVSHMGELRVRGPGAVAAVQRLVSNDLAKVADGVAMYSPMCNPRGGIVDDCIVYRVRADELLIVFNAGNIAKDVAHIRAVCGDAPECTLVDECDATALLAVQGPTATRILAPIAKLDGAEITGLKKNRHVTGSIAGIAVRVAATGYTGEDGVEVFCAAADAGALWDAILKAGGHGEPDGILPIGLGARDTLRLEARLCLYGNDIDDDTTPYEAGLDWTVKLGKGDFVGRDALVKQQAEGVRKKLVGFVMKGRGIARHGYAIHGVGPAEGAGPLLGTVTSGTTGPSLGVAIGMGYVPTASAEPGAPLVIDCRGKLTPAEIVAGPFYRRPTSKEPRT